MFNFQALIKYLLEGLAVAVAAFFIPARRVEVKEVVLIALTAAAVFAILDQFSPSIAVSARQGAGFGIGLNQVGWGMEPDDHYYGGQSTRLGPDKVNCTCEVSAEDLPCPLHVKGNSESESQSSQQHSEEAAKGKAAMAGGYNDEPLSEQEDMDRNPDQEQMPFPDGDGPPGRGMMGPGPDMGPPGQDMGPPGPDMGPPGPDMEMPNEEQKIEAFDGFSKHF